MESLNDTILTESMNLNVEFIKGAVIDLIYIPTNKLESVISGIRKIKTLSEFQNKRLGFILFLELISKYCCSTEVGPLFTSNCSICGLIEEDVHSKSQNEIVKILLQSSLCEGHMVSYLTILKQIDMVGKELLIALIRVYP